MYPAIKPSADGPTGRQSQRTLPGSKKPPCSLWQPCNKLPRCSTELCPPRSWEWFCVRHSWQSTDEATCCSLGCAAPGRPACCRGVRSGSCGWTRGLQSVGVACGCRAVQTARCPLVGEGMYLWRYGWVLSIGAELGAECAECPTDVWEPWPCEGASSVVYLHCDVSLHKGPALGSCLPAEGAGMSQVWKAASLEQRRVWWVTALGGVSSRCQTAMGKLGTPGDANTH